VRTAWGQELAVFAQNDGADAAARRGDDVVVTWRPEHAFPLRDEEPTAAQDEAPQMATAAP
jgi:hypothetical protein